MTSDDAEDGERRPERISVTREELEALIEEAVRKDRALR